MSSQLVQRIVALANQLRQERPNQYGVREQSQEIQVTLRMAGRMHSRQQQSFITERQARLQRQRSYVLQFKSKGIQEWMVSVEVGLWR